MSGASNEVDSGQAVAAGVPDELVDRAKRIENPYWRTVKDRVSAEATWFNRGRPFVPRWSNPEFVELLTGHIAGPHEASREWLSVEYTWAVPSPEAIAFVTHHSRGRIVEMGAGTGYWAWMLTQMGADVVAYDTDPPDKRKNSWHHAWHDVGDEPVDPLRSVFYDVQYGQPPSLSQHADRTLLLCWPPYATSMATRCLRMYEGDRLIYIGEGSGGCTGDDKFFRMLDRWEPVASFPMVQWEGIHDDCRVFRRSMR